MKPLENSTRKVVAEWLFKADEDMELADFLLSHDVFHPNAIAFSAQQAAEKYLKAFLAWKQIDFPKTHDLERLLVLVEKVDSELAAYLKDVTVLTLYSVELRYPGGQPEVSPNEAHKAVELARKARESVREKLSSM